MSGTNAPKSPKDEYATYQHRTAKRPNLPTNEMADDMEVRDVSHQYHTATRRENDAPQLAWDRSQSLYDSTPHRPLFIQEKIHPGALIDSLRRPLQYQQMTLFNEFNGLSDEQYTQWYQHKANWQNRLIHGNSLEIGASLADREGLAGQVQMIYFDPPYGIKFKSNFALEAGKGDGDESVKSVGADPTSVKAFIDTWEKGIHSYLDAIHKHATMARDLLADRGSLFVQIGDENMMRVGTVLDEVFGAENRIATISFVKSGATSSDTLSSIADYILWYSKNKPALKYHQLYEPYANRAELLNIMSRGQCLETATESRALTVAEKRDPETIPKDSRLFRDMRIASQGESTTDRSGAYDWEGRIFPCPSGEHWRVSLQGLDRLATKQRLFAGKGKLLGWKRYENEIPGRRINNIWSRTMAPSDKRYVVQTANSVIERCMLMATDPGDLVLDFTSGSGTTALVAEQWGRRWIAIDASQVAIATARTRMITALFDYHAISGSPAGEEAERLLQAKPKLKAVKRQALESANQDPANGFVYRRVPYVSAGILAYDLEDETPPIYLVDQPVKVSGVTRVCSPFTVESDHPFRYLPVDATAVAGVADETAGYYKSQRKNFVKVLEKTGIRRIDGTQLEINNLQDCLTDPITHIATYRKKGQAEDTGKQMAIACAPDDAIVSVGFMRKAGKVARQQLGREVDMVTIFGFAFDPDTSEFNNLINLPIARVQMNRQFQIAEIKIEKADDNAFVMLGEPDIEVTAEGEQWRVKVKGFATFDPASGNAVFGETKDIYSWLMDTDYDGRSFFARRIHFPGQHGDKHIKKLKKALIKVLNEDAYKAMLSNTSMPFPKPQTGQIAVKIITRTGDEMICTHSFY